MTGEMTEYGCRLQDLSDEILVKRAKARGAVDDRPFAVLFERHKHMVWSVSYRFMANGEDAEDLLQEVFINAYRGLPSFEGRSAFRTWLYQIAINTCRNELRRRQRRPDSIETPMDDLKLADPAPSPGSSQGEWREIVATAMINLHPDEREILILRDFEDRPYDEIATLQEIRLSAAKMRVQRARIALYSELRGFIETEETG
ncbi:MAG: RNA polymerase sigma factor [Anaerolineales bacterium]|nr:RNA polymerase sigma factor [Anaerolineales bacterium]